MSIVTKLGIVAGAVVMVFVINAIFNFFGVSFYNNSIMIFFVIWAIVLLIFFAILPRDYKYFTKPLRTMV